MWFLLWDSLLDDWSERGNAVKPLSTGISCTQGRITSQLNGFISLARGR